MFFLLSWSKWDGQLHLSFVLVLWNPVWQTPEYNWAFKKTNSNYRPLWRWNAHAANLNSTLTPLTDRWRMSYQDQPRSLRKAQSEAWLLGCGKRLSEKELESKAVDWAIPGAQPILQWKVLSEPPGSMPATAKGSLNLWTTSIYLCINIEVRLKQRLKKEVTKLPTEVRL